MSDPSTSFETPPAPTGPDLMGPVAFAARLGGGLAELHQPTRLQWQRGPLGARPSRWLWATSALALMGLLVAFLWVVQSGVARGQWLRESTAQQADAAWRCKTQPVHELRDACFARLAAGPDTGPRAVAALVP